MSEQHVDWAEVKLARYGYVTGHDGLLHRAKHDGTTACGMGRSQNPTYHDAGPATCLRCLASRPWGDF